MLPVLQDFNDKVVFLWKTNNLYMVELGPTINWRQSRKDGEWNKILNGCFGGLGLREDHSRSGFQMGFSLMEGPRCILSLWWVWEGVPAIHMQFGRSLSKGITNQVTPKRLEKRNFPILWASCVSIWLLQKFQKKNLIFWGKPIRFFTYKNLLNEEGE